MSKKTSVNTTARAVILLAALGTAAANGATITTADPGVIAAFQAGATVQNFDALTAQTITDYNAQPATATFFNQAGQDIYFNSGGGNFFNPAATDPTTATPIGIFNPSGGIAGDKLSPANVAGPLEINTTTAFGPGAFMEILFPVGVSKIGFYVPYIEAGDTLTLFLKDENAGNISGADSGGVLTAGQFIGITRSSPDVRGLALISGTGKFTIDDLTVGGASNNNDVPEAASMLSLGLAALLLAGARRALPRL